MDYENIVAGIFRARPNRFIAHVEIGGQLQTVHVKNTGRCRELLVEGAQVWCQYRDEPTRKTKYDLICVRKGQRIINMDSQAPNAAARQWLEKGALGEIRDLKLEYTHGESRFDFAFTKGGRRCFLEVKGVTLEHGGVCAFPDAPTARGVKHLRHLTALARQGYGAYVLFVIQMENAVLLRPNDETDPAFGNALREAARAGVQVMAVECAVTPRSMTITAPVETDLTSKSPKGTTP